MHELKIQVEEAGGWVKVTMFSIIFFRNLEPSSLAFALRNALNLIKIKKKEK